MRGRLSSLIAGLCLSAPNVAYADTPPPPARYVAMGSSFAAGPGIMPMRTGGTMRCGQSAANYASLLAARLGLALDDRSCGGATTAHILGPWNELPPQIDAVTPDTRLVTMTIGGNDLNYASNVFAASCDRDEPFAAGTQTIHCPVMKLPTEADFAKLETNLREIARQVHQRAPDARLVFVQYVTLVPGRACPAARIANDAARTLRVSARRLATITARVAHDSHAFLLPADRMSRRHTPCDAQPWSVGFPRHFQISQGMPWHPNAAGMIAIADGIAKLMAHG